MAITPKIPDLAEQIAELRTKVERLSRPRAMHARLAHTATTDPNGNPIEAWYWQPIPNDGWQAFTAQSSWNAHDAASLLMPDGTIQLRGHMSGTAPSGGGVVTIGQVAAAHTPTRTVAFGTSMVYSGADYLVQCQITSSGAVQLVDSTLGQVTEVYFGSVRYASRFIDS